MRKRYLMILLALAFCLLLAGCGPAGAVHGSGQADADSAAESREGEDAMSRILTYPDTKPNNEGSESEGTEVSMWMKIGETEVSVDWEDNASVNALMELCQEEPLSIRMSMYGGFEQVGPIGQSLPAEDARTTTQAGDIVLYSSDQIVVFYGSNTWAYTRLGHITDPSAQEVARLLGNGDVTITIGMG